MHSESNASLNCRLNRMNKIVHIFGKLHTFMEKLLGELLEYPFQIQEERVNS